MMGYVKTVILFTTILFIGEIAGDELITPCNPNDLECIDKSAIEFMENTHAGNPAFGVEAVDPLTLPTMDIEGIGGWTIQLTDVKVTGLRKLHVIGFKLDEVAKETRFNATLPLNIESKAKYTNPDKSKSYTGTLVISESKSEIRTRYNWEIVKDDKNVEHFKIAQEETDCEAVDHSKFTINEELMNELKNDPDMKAKIQEYKAKKEEARGKLVCKIAVEAFASVMKNFRAASKYVPTSAYFKT